MDSMPMSKVFWTTIRILIFVKNDPRYSFRKFAHLNFVYPRQSRYISNEFYTVPIVFFQCSIDILCLLFFDFWYKSGTFLLAYVFSSSADFWSNLFLFLPVIFPLPVSWITHSQILFPLFLLTKLFFTSDPIFSAFHRNIMNNEYGRPSEECGP